MKRYKQLVKPIVALAAVGLWLYVHRYATARMPTACEQLTAAVAVDFVMPELCKRIPIEAERGEGGFSTPGFQIDSLRSDCFLQTAIATNDIRLCREVKPVRSSWPEFVDGSGYNEAYCLDQVGMSHGNVPSGGVTMADSELAPVMHRLGYTEQTLHDAGVDVKTNAFPVNTFAWDDYIHQLIWIRPGMPRYEHLRQERTNFLDKVDQLRCRPPFADAAWKVCTAVVLAVVTLFSALRIWSILR